MATTPSCDRPPYAIELHRKVQAVARRSTRRDPMISPHRGIRGLCFPDCKPPPVKIEWACGSMEWFAEQE